MDSTSLLSTLRIVPIDTEVLPARCADFFEKNRAKLHIAVLYENEARTGKLWPAVEIVNRGIARGDHGNADTATDSTSGNFGRALKEVVDQANREDPAFPIKRVVAVVPRSLPPGKRKQLTDQSIDLIDAADSMAAMDMAKRAAEERGYWYTRQYWNEDNSRGYWPVANYIADHLRELGMLVCGVGSGGHSSGLSSTLTLRFKEERKLPFWRAGVVVEEGEQVGGVRGERALEPGSLAWRAPNVDDVRFVGNDPSLRFSAALWRQDANIPGKGLVCGPSTGFASEGAWLAARNLVMMRRFDEFRASDGFVHILVPSLDTRDPYREEYAEKGIYF